MTEQAMAYRAARAWAGLTQAQLAKRLGIDVQTVKRRESGGADPKLFEQIAVAHVCKVPLEFLTGGFGALGAEPSGDETRGRLEHLEGAMRVLVGVAAGISMTELQDQLTDRTTRELLGLDAGGSGRSDRSKDDATGAS